MSIIRPNETEKTAPKNGRISPLAGNNQPDDRVFRNKFQGLRKPPQSSGQRFGVGRGESLVMSQDRTLSSAARVNPLNSFHRTATGNNLAPRTANGATQVSPFGVVPEIQPHEKGSHFMRSALPVMRRAGGPDAGTNTPFHPVKGRSESSGRGRKVMANPEPRSAIFLNKTFHPSFVSHGHNASDPAGDRNFGRWNTVKKGVV